jgi:excisionase family DNA binding protein
MPAKADRSHVEASVMTVLETAEYLHVHQSTIYRLLKRGEIPAFKVGSDWRFNRETVDRWRLAQTASVG